VVGIIPAWFQLPYGVTSAANVRFEIFRPLVLSQQEQSRNCSPPTRYARWSRRPR
jgi:hypothetical protein